VYDHNLLLMALPPVLPILSTALFYPQTDFWLDAPLLLEVLFSPDIAPAATFLPLQFAVAVGPKSHHLGLCRGLCSHRTSNQIKIFFLVSFTNFTRLNL
jgi:hypothetical protein